MIKFLHILKDLINLNILLLLKTLLIIHSSTVTHFLDEKLVHYERTLYSMKVKRSSYL